MNAPLPDPPRPPVMETYREKATRKFHENPWVPLGSLATVGALVTAMVKMRRGESRSFNHWLRVRVAAQGLTIVALVAGTYSLAPGTKPATLPDGTPDPDAGARGGVLEQEAERRREERKSRERGEFEERVREAEREVERERGAGPVEHSAPVVSPPITPVQAGSGSGGWRRWVPGWGKSGKKDDGGQNKS
ncbi:hypoxia induced protein conserved region-domain-containing protein [Infundibulicybe gibba]|nr:hypoxia induced protein conserved region-domain-containing protein [Infundibulicybe gibba]